MHIRLHVYVPMSLHLMFRTPKPQPLTYKATVSQSEKLLAANRLQRDRDIRYLLLENRSRIMR
jgi:hypothetical protein